MGKGEFAGSPRRDLRKEAARMIDPRIGEQLELFPEFLEEVARQKQEERKRQARARRKKELREMKQVEQVQPPKLAEVIPFRPKGVVTVTDWGGDAS
jgi:hypothetical protein